MLVADRWSSVGGPIRPIGVEPLLGRHGMAWGPRRSWPAVTEVRPRTGARPCRPFGITQSRPRLADQEPVSGHEPTVAGRQHVGLLRQLDGKRVLPLLESQYREAVPEPWVARLDADGAFQGRRGLFGLPGIGERLRSREQHHGRGPGRRGLGCTGSRRGER